MRKIFLSFVGIYLVTHDCQQCISALPAYSNLTMTVNVPFGKAAVLDFTGIRNHLASLNETLPLSRCWIRVLNEEPMYSRVGFVEPANFSCAATSVSYTHLGFESPNEDVVKLRMAYYSPTDFIEHTLFVVLRIADRGAGNLILKGLPLRMNEMSGGTETKQLLQQAISRKAILLSQEDFPDSCHIHTVTRTLFPRFGRLNIAPDDRLTCDQFFSGEIHYELTAEILSSHDLIILRVDTLDENATAVSEYFQMTVAIENGEENSPPEISFAALCYLDVQNSVVKSISREVLLAEDKDGAAEDLFYRVAQAPALEEGFLVRLDNPVHPIESFTQKDVNLMKIAFRPPLVDVDDDRVIEGLILEIVDVEGLISDAVALLVVVKPATYAAPFVIFNKGLTLYEGEAATLWNSKNLAIADENSLDEVVVRVVSGLAHGRLLNGDRSVKQFVAADLQTGALCYQHDGSDTLIDSLVLQMDDGKHQVEFLVPITIIPYDDEAPLLLTNTGVLVHTANQTVMITRKTLRAKDFDSEQDAIRYTLSTASAWGSFFLLNDSKESEVLSWTESDIAHGRLHYRHSGDAHQTTTTWYTMDFSLQDNNNPPNISPHLHTLTVTFIPQDRQKPQLSPTASMVLRVNASQVAIIGNGILHFVDDFTRDKNLELIVRATPLLGSLIWAGASGHRSDEDIPERFPQSYLSYGEILYQAPSLPIVDAESSAPGLKDSLVVDVKDKQGNILADQKLDIFVEAPKARKARYSHKTPAVFSKLVLVKEGQVASLSDYLVISDPDTHLSAIHLKLVEAPGFGILRLNNKSLTVDDSFTADHVHTGGVVYQNIRLPAHWEDVARLNVTTDDWSEEFTTQLTFRVIPSPEPPKSSRTKFGLSKLGLVIQVPEGSEYILTRSTLLGSAGLSGYPPADLTFELGFSPRNGALLVNGSETDRFSWKDVEKQRVAYRSAEKIDQEDNTLFDDVLSFRVVSVTDEWVLSDKVIDHLEIQILLVPRSATISLGKTFTVEEGQSAVLSEEHLVIVAPYYQLVNCSLVEAPLYGALFDVVNKKDVRHFSNYDIREHRIEYQQTLHQKLEPRGDFIKLSCAGKWVEIPVTIIPANDEPPFLTVNQLHVSVDDQVPLGSFITLMDADEPADNLTVDVISFPRHGLIIGNFTTADANEIQVEPAFRPIRTFPAGDLLMPERIFYRHDGSQSLTDQFTLLVFDGINSVEKVVEVAIHEREEGPTHDEPTYGYVEFISSPVELVGAEPETRYYNATTANASLQVLTTVAPARRTAMPNITFSAPVQALTLLPNKHLGVILTSGVIKVQRNNDSAEKELLFEIVKPPKSGVFLDLTSPERVINVFTESALQQADIAYALFPENEDATEDSFTFQAINEFGTRSQLLHGRFNWSWISFAVDKVETNEVMGSVKIEVRRRGSLQNRDFVAIKARDLSATMGRDYKEDFALQAEFQPGQNETTVEIKILKDDQYEDREHFQLVLEEPQLANVEKPFVATVTITDQDDGAMVYIPLPLYFVKENVGIYNLTLKRNGRDLVKPLSVICYTTDGTASGTISRHQQIFRPDFVSRLNIHSSVVVFAPNETTQVCPIVIVNDPFAENDERLFVNIRALGHSRLGIYQQTELVILRDIEDEPSVSFSKNEYSTTIFEPFVEVQIDRKGGDMNQPSEVDLMSEEGKLIEAIYFGQGESTQTVAIKSTGSLNVSNDVFRVYLNNSQYAQILSPNFATIHVRKTMNLTVLSSMGNGGLTENEIILLGNYDNNEKSQSREAKYECLNCDTSTEISMKTKNATRKASALAAVSSVNKTVLPHRGMPRYDLVVPLEKLLTELVKPKYVRFYPEEQEQQLDDSWKGGMDTPKQPAAGVPVVRGTARLPAPSDNLPATRQSGINASTIAFAKAHYDAHEPINNRQPYWISLLITRTGNLSRSDSVRAVTKNGSARAGSDFQSVDTVLNFAVNRSQEVLQIRILYDGVREGNENFTVHLYPLRRTLADVTKSMTTVTIQERSGGNVRFPGSPLVTTLTDYEHPTPGGWIAIGQPAVCVTTCNPRHPDYARTSRVCVMEDIDDSQTGYSWKISHPLDDSLTLEPLQHIRSSTWFADINEAVLDNIYYTNGSIVQCAARAVTKDGQGGFESISEIVTAVGMEANCPSSQGRANSVDIDPYQASISNMKNGDVKLTIVIPHRTGLVPLLSTAHISDDISALVVSGDGLTRTAEHTCSNMISAPELRTANGFLKYQAYRDAGGVSALEKLRGNKTLEFYRNLDGNNCRWTFETTYSMSEVINLCGGKLISENTHRTSSRREVSIQLPLYVSYAYFTNAIGQPWKHYAQSTVLDIVFTYNSDLMWSPDSIPVSSSPSPPSALAGPDMSAAMALTTPFPTDLKVLQVKIEQNSHHMSARFKTKPKFRGKFVTEDTRRILKISAGVVQVGSPSTGFELKLLRTQENSAQPQQLWRFRTLRANKINYVGMYNITLIPCEFSTESTVDCTIQPPVVFNVHISDR